MRNMEKRAVLRIALQLAPGLPTVPATIKIMTHFSTAGESHGEALIAQVSGLPAGVPTDLEFVNRDWNGTAYPL